MTEELDVIEKQVKTLPDSIYHVLDLLNRGWDVQVDTSFGSTTVFATIRHGNFHDCGLHWREINAGIARGLLQHGRSRKGDTGCLSHIELTDLGKEVVNQLKPLI